MQKFVILCCCLTVNQNLIVNSGRQFNISLDNKTVHGHSLGGIGLNIIDLKSRIISLS